MKKKVKKELKPKARPKKLITSEYDAAWKTVVRRDMTRRPGMGSFISWNW